jgi:hypothetical protein
MLRTFYNLEFYTAKCLWLIDCTSRSRLFYLYGDVTIAGEGMQNLRLCSALRAFKQGGICIVQHLLWHGTSVFPVSSETPPHLFASYDTWGDVEDLFYTGSSRDKIVYENISDIS